MRNYEITLVVDASLTDEEAGQVLDKFKGIIEKGGSKIAFESSWGRRKLAYEINKKAHGIYTLLYTEASAETLKELEVQFGYDDKVLKHFVYRVEDLEIAHTKFEKLKAEPMMNVNLLSEAAQGGL